MENRDLDAKCAEILGCKVKWWKDPAIGDEVPECHCDTGRHGGLIGKGLLCYSTDANASRELLEWGFNHNVVGFGKVLIYRLQVPTQATLQYWIVPILLATPRQVAESFAECFGGAK